MPLLALGPHKFEIAPLNFQSIERNTIAKWPAIARFGGAPGRQFTGFGEDTIKISGLLFPDELGGREEFEEIRATQKAARPVTMLGWIGLDGTAARVFGRVVILQVSDTQTYINHAGAGRKLSFDVEIAPMAGGGKPVGLF